MGYCGARTIEDLQDEGALYPDHAAAVQESHPHGIQITKEAPNYGI